MQNFLIVGWSLTVIIGVVLIIKMIRNKIKKQGKNNLYAYLITNILIGLALFISIGYNLPTSDNAENTILLELEPVTIVETSAQIITMPPTTEINLAVTETTEIAILTSNKDNDLLVIDLDALQLLYMQIEPDSYENILSLVENSGLDYLEIEYKGSKSKSIFVSTEPLKKAHKGTGILPGNNDYLEISFYENEKYKPYVFSNMHYKNYIKNADVIQHYSGTYWGLKQADVGLYIDDYSSYITTFKDSDIEAKFNKYKPFSSKEEQFKFLYSLDEKF